MTDFKIEFDFTEKKLRESIPDYLGNYTELFEILLDIFPKYRISNEERVAGFLEQIGYKSNVFQNISALKPSNDSMLRQFATFNKISAAEAYKYCDTLKGSIDSAGWFWNIKYLNNVADNFDFKNLTERVNTGSDINERKENFYRIYSVLQQGLEK